MLCSIYVSVLRYAICLFVWHWRPECSTVDVMPRTPILFELLRSPSLADPPPPPTNAHSPTKKVRAQDARHVSWRVADW